MFWNNTNLYLTFLLALTAISGDFLVSHTKIKVIKAVFDNVTHALIGGFCWLIITINNKNYNTYQSLYEILACICISSFIDLDHFIAAKSIYLEDATSLQNRPFLHSSTIPFLLSTLLLIISYSFRSNWMQKVSLITFTAFASHHTRDATRRGYWFGPYGSTAAIPYYLYLFITILIPYIVSFILKHVQIDKVYQYTHLDV